MEQSAKAQPLAEENKKLKRQLNSFKKKLSKFETRLLERDLELKKVKDSEQRAKSILKASPNPIVIYDMEGKVQFLNKPFTKIFGWRLDELKGRKIDFVPEESLPETIRKIKEMIAGKKVEFQSKRYTKNRKILVVDISAGSFQDDLGNLIGSFVILRDITERKQAEKRIKTLNLELKQKADDLEALNQSLEQAVEHAREMTTRAETAARAKSAFLANMSHEIRTPMNGVIGMADLLLETPLTPEQKEFVQTIQISGDSLLSLINDILDYSKIDAGKLDLEQIDFDLRVMIDSVGDLMAVKAQEKGLEYITLLKPDVPVLLQGDPSRVRQILLNLVGNAVKFTKTGEILINVTLEEETDQNAKLKFTVKDTGIGIPEDKMSLLFKTFSQVDASTTRKYGGTGLGLTISRRLAQLMNGETGVESKKGKGSEFWFTAVFKKQVLRPSTGSAASDIKKKRVLIIDDNQTNRFVISEQLKFWGCLSEQAEDGADGLKKLLAASKNKTPYDLAIVDMQMPHMDGRTLGIKIKSTPLIKNTPLIMMTSIGERGEVKELEKIGFSAYLCKPVKMANLHACLLKVCAIPENLEEKEPQRIVTRYSLSEEKTQNIRILLAEDNRINQKVAVNMVNKMGFHVDIANNGREAVEVLKTKNFDLVLMDCQMPELDGYEATKQIRDPDTGVKNPEIPIIAMTANAMKGDRDKCIQYGMNDYISKPVKPKNLLDIINKWSGKKP